jgi:predicted O-linked N-acetylglucosamine transferase (SPINDLY family)
MTRITIDQAMQIAIGHHQAGRLAEAEPIYRQVLGQVPDHPDALHLLGAVACQTGHLAAAIELIGRAIAINSDVAEYHGTLGEAYRRSGQQSAAIAGFRRALELKPDLALAHGNLGIALQAEGRLDEAIAALCRSVEIEPNDAVVESNLGLALLEAGRIEEAVAAHERAVALGPANSASLRNLGVALHSAGRSGAAIAAYQRALVLAPDDANTCNNLGMTLLETGRIDEAIAALSRAVALSPSLAQSQNNLGNALRDSGRLDEARSALERAIALKPGLADAYNNLGNVLKDQGRIHEALDAFRKAAALSPQDAKTASNLLFSLHADPDIDAQALLAEHRRWALRFAAPLAAQIQPHPNDRTPDRRLRIGYVSPDFRAHAVGHLLLALLAHHDHDRFEIVAYAEVRTHDSVTRQLQALTDRWRDTTGLGDPQLADQIRTDRIDILVDLALHTAGNRMLVFARKPAPVQVTMLGLPTTTGLDTIDYRLTDPYLDPPGETDADYSEQSIRLPHSFWVFQPPDDSPPVSALPAETKAFVTFGCLNQFTKVSRPALELWVKILQALPDARLVIQAPEGSPRAAVHALFEEGGIIPDRVAFVAKAPRRAYFERFGDLDLGLDPFPYNGHTSTLDALWMGVPVVTLAGRTAVARGGVSTLSNLGLTELIAHTPEQYVDIAVTWARDRTRLATLRAGLRQRMLASALTDGRQFAADVEAAFRQMWEQAGRSGSC